MKYRARLQNVESGEERWSDAVDLPEGNEYATPCQLAHYFWDVGNMECDCNRENYFDESEQTAVCNTTEDTRRYRLLRLEFEDGTLVPKE